MRKPFSPKFYGVYIVACVTLWRPVSAKFEGSEGPLPHELASYDAAQAPSVTTESALETLVQKLAQPLKAAKAKHVVVLDLRGPNGGLYPAGKLISDHLSVAIGTEFPKLKIIDRSQLIPSVEMPGTPTEVSAGFKTDIQEARSVGADVFISGNFAEVSGQIGISLHIVKLSELEETHEVRSGLIPIPKEIEDQTSDAIPPLQLEDGFPRAGESGINMPVCSHCPTPSNGLTGLVTLEIIVTKDGRPDRIRVLKTPSPELAAAAARLVQAWRFKPAAGFDGNPIAVITPIEITFR
jgi:TonB family protein